LSAEDLAKIQSNFNSIKGSQAMVLVTSADQESVWTVDGPNKLLLNLLVNYARNFYSSLNEKLSTFFSKGKISSTTWEVRLPKLLFIVAIPPTTPPF